MKWWAFIPLLLIAVVVDTSLAPVLAIGPVEPMATPSLIVLVAMYAQRQTALWAAFIAGIIVDLNAPALFDGVRPYVLIGPSALAFVLGAAIVLPMRSMVVRRNPLAFGVLVILFCLGAMLLTTAIYSIRSWYAGTTAPWMPEGRALGWMGLEALKAISSGCLGVVLAWPLQKLTGVLGFSGNAPWSSRRG